MYIARETVGLQTVYRLRGDDPDLVLGEAVVSESSDEIRLHGIFVRPEHRGRGLGQALMQAVLSIGEAKVVTLCTGPDNVSFFRRFGFQVVHVGESLVSMERRL